MIPLDHPEIFKTECLINGKWLTNDKKITIRNPFDKSQIAQVPELSKHEIEASIDSAWQAFLLWKKSSVTDRHRVLKKWSQLLLENSEDIARIMVHEQGKPINEAIGEVKYAASYFEFYAEEAIRVYGKISPSPFPRSKIFVFKEPVGVVGIITPWNFPVAMMARKIAPALAVGCTCIVKPDEKTPLSAFSMAYLGMKAGLPDGVINFITGEPDTIGQLLCENTKVSKISFTGSTEVGKLLMQRSAVTMKRITLELGGNAPFIVFSDADIDKAVEGLIAAKFRNAGQTCVCANRIFLHEAIEKEFIERLNPRLQLLRLENGLNTSCEIGPLINESAVIKIEHLLHDAISKGAAVKSGGKRLESDSLFFQPTLVTQITKEMKIFSEEIFGPVVTVVTFKNTEEVIELANNTRYGLSSYFYTKNMDTVFKVASELEYGMVGINTGTISSAMIPFGGVKESGFGREGSRYSINDYINLKYVCLSDLSG